MSTIIGKTLVIMITCLALLFLGVSTVVYSTARDWPKAFAAEQTKIDALKKKFQALRQEADVAKKGLDDAKAALATEIKALGARLSTIEEESKRDIDTEATVREQLAIAEETARKTLLAVQAKREQIDRLHKQQAAVERQANEFRAHQALLGDRIRELERILQAAAKNKHDLRSRPSGKLSAMVR